MVWVRAKLAYVWRRAARGRGAMDITDDQNHAAADQGG